MIEGLVARAVVVWIWWIVVFGALVVVLFVLFVLKFYFVWEIVCWVVVVLGFNLIVGFVGEVLFGYVVFMGVGVYIVVIFVADYGWLLLVMLLVVVGVCGVLGLVIGVLVLWFRGLYLVFFMLVVGVLFGLVVKWLRWLINGFDGKLLKRMF